MQSGLRSSGMNNLSKQCREAKGEVGVSWGRIYFGYHLVLTAPSVHWALSRYTQVFLESWGRPPGSRTLSFLLLGTCSCEGTESFIHSFTHMCKASPISGSVKDAKSVGILRPHTQVENTEMLTDCYRIIKIYTKMKHQTIPGKVAGEMERRQEIGAVALHQGCVCPLWTDLHYKELSSSKMNGRNTKEVESVAFSN